MAAKQNSCQGLTFIITRSISCWILLDAVLLGEEQATQVETYRKEFE